MKKLIRLLILFQGLFNGCSFAVNEEPCLNCEDAIYKSNLHGKISEYYTEVSTIDTINGFNNDVIYTISTISPLYPDKTKFQMVGTPSSLGCGCPIQNFKAWLSQDILVGQDTVKANTNLFLDSIYIKINKQSGFGDVIEFKDDVVFKTGQNFIFLEGESPKNKIVIDTVKFFVADSVGF